MVTLWSPDWISITVVQRMVLGFSIALLMVFNMLMVGSAGTSTSIHTLHDQSQVSRKQHEAEAGDV